MSEKVNRRNNFYVRFQLIMGIFRLGFFSSYLSDQLVSGFTTGAAVHVFVSQLDKIFGVKIGLYQGPGKLYFVSYVVQPLF